jgi:phosphoglycolate phosphatase
MDTVGVTWGFRDRAELEAFKPKYLVDHPSQVIDILEGLLKNPKM